jgi:hypothetical protein
VLLGAILLGVVVEHQLVSAQTSAIIQIQTRYVKSTSSRFLSFPIPNVNEAGCRFERGYKRKRFALAEIIESQNPAQLPNPSATIAARKFVVICATTDSPKRP